MTRDEWRIESFCDDLGDRALRLVSTDRRADDVVQRLGLPVAGYLTGSDAAVIVLDSDQAAAFIKTYFQVGGE